MCHQLHLVKSEKRDPVKLEPRKCNFRKEENFAALFSLPCHLLTWFLHFKGDERLFMQTFPKQSFLTLPSSWRRIWGRFIVSFCHVSFLWSNEPVLPSHKPFLISLFLIKFNFPTEERQIPQAFLFYYARVCMYMKAWQPHEIGKLVKRGWEVAEESQGSLQLGLQGGKRGFSAYWELSRLSV